MLMILILVYFIQWIAIDNNKRHTTTNSILAFDMQVEPIVVSNCESRNWLRILQQF